MIPFFVQPFLYYFGISGYCCVHLCDVSELIELASLQISNLDESKS